MRIADHICIALTAELREGTPLRVADQYAAANLVGNDVGIDVYDTDIRKLPDRTPGPQGQDRKDVILESLNVHRDAGGLDASHIVRQDGCRRLGGSQRLEDSPVGRSNGLVLRR